MITSYTCRQQRWGKKVLSLLRGSNYHPTQIRRHYHCLVEAARWSSSGWRMTSGVQMSPSFLSVSGLFWARSQHGLLSLLLIPTLFVLLSISKGFNVFHTLRTKDGSEYVWSQRGSWPGLGHLYHRDIVRLCIMRLSSDMWKVCEGVDKTKITKWHPARVRLTNKH